MNIIKKTTIIIAALLFSIAFVASCSKGTNAKKGKKAQAAAKADEIPKAKGLLGAIRKGRNAELNWHLETSTASIRQINVIRSSTGINKQVKVAELEPSATNYTDTLPDEHAYWYWIRLLTVDGKNQDIGPTTVEADKSGGANYAGLYEDYKIAITRTDDLATLKWDFPENEYKSINIFRFTHPVAGMYKTTKNATAVLATLSGKSQYTNALPDANADYWYWFRITTKSGAVINKGPIKAEYAN